MITSHTPVETMRRPAATPEMISALCDVDRVHTIYAALCEWDLELVKAQAVEKGTLPVEHIDAAADEYRKFLALCVAYPQVATRVSDGVDQFWHTHILCTEDYACMCATVIGYFVHHRPHLLETVETISRRPMDVSMALYERAFGTPPIEVWGDTFGLCDNCTNCAETCQRGD